MLVLDHPRTPHVFAASKQLDLILDYCKLITLQDTSAGRQFMLEVIRPAFAALRWLNLERFGGSSEIRSGIDQLELEASALAGLPSFASGRSKHAKTRCPACGDSPTSPSQYDPRSYCRTCLDLIIDGLSRVRSSEGGFGADAI
jgi:hypothetical protein